MAKKETKTTARKQPVAKRTAPAKPAKAPAKPVKTAAKPAKAPARTARIPAGRAAISAKAAPKSAPRPHHGLGRGLGALIGEAAPAARVAPRAEVAPAVTAAESAAPAAPIPAPEAPAPAVPAEQAVPTNVVIQVKTTLSARSPWQPRATFDEESLRELSESIKTHGVIQPLVCRRLPADKGGGYELIAGERRLRAAIDAGLTEVPVVLSDAEDKTAAEMTIIENIQRQDLNVIEEAVGYKTLADEFGLTQQDVADRVGKSRPSVANALRLLELPDEVKMLLSSSLLSTGHAKVLLSLTDETEQTLLGRRCVEEQLTVRALERLIARRAVEKNTAGNKKLDIPESHVRYLLEKLHAKFGAPVRLQPSVTFANGKRAKGSIEIDFADNDDLSRLLDIFGVDVE